MNYSNYRLTLDVNDIRSSNIVKVKKNSNTKRLCISLTEGGKVYQISNGCTASIQGKRPDGEPINIKCDIEGNSIFYVIGNFITEVVGLAECEIRLIGTDKMMLFSATFSILVEDTFVDPDYEYESSAEVPELVSLLAETTALKNEIETKLENGEFKGEKGDPGEDGSTMVDDKMDLHSTNPVQNRVVYNEFIDVRSEMNDLDIKIDSAKNNEKVLFADDGVGNVSISLVDRGNTAPAPDELDYIHNLIDTANGEIAALKVTATEARNTAYNAQTIADEAIGLARGVSAGMQSVSNTANQVQTGLSSVQTQLTNGVLPSLDALETGLSSVSTQAINAENVANDATTVANDAQYTANLVKQGLELSVLPRLDALEAGIGGIDAFLDDIIVSQEQTIAAQEALIADDGGDGE